MLVQLLELAENMAEIDYVTDNLGLSNTFNKGPEAGYHSINADLFHQIFAYTLEKAIRLSVRWIPSHLLENPTKGVFSCKTHLDMVGNSRADILANQAALQACVPLNISAPILYYIALCKRIQHRLTTIICNLPNRPKRPPKIIEPRVPLQSICDNSSHILHESDSRIACARCHNSFNKHDPALRGWLQCMCQAIGSSSDKPIPLSLTQLHSGNRVTHHSHKLLQYRGLVYCNKCGSRDGRLGYKKLASQCAPPTPYGIQSLKALRECIKPPGLDRWPDEHPIAAPTCTLVGTKRKLRFMPRRPYRPRPIAVGMGDFGRTTLGSFLDAPPAPPPLTIEYPPELEVKQKQFIENIHDMVELAEDGFSVSWPEGMDLQAAKTLIATGLIPASKPTGASSSCGAAPDDSLGIPPQAVDVPVAPDPQSIYRAKVPAQPLQIRKRTRKCISIEEYRNTKQRAGVANNASGSQSLHESTVPLRACSQFDDPDADVELSSSDG